MLDILLIDHHVLFRECIASLIRGRADLKLIGVGDNGVEAIRLAHDLEPDIILMDLHMPVMDGFEATRIIRKELPHIKIIVLTVLDSDDELFAAIQLGVDGYLPKFLEPQQLFEMITRVRLGETALPTSITTRIVQNFRETASSRTAREPHIELSCRELEVLRVVAQGAKDKEIAVTLDISKNTVKNHLRNILNKLGMQNRIQAAVYAVREGIA